MPFSAFRFGSSQAARRRCVRELIDSWNARTYDRLEAFVTDDVVIEDANGLQICGREALAEHMQKLYEHIGENRIVIDTMDNHGERVLIRGHFECASEDMAGGVMWQMTFSQNKVSHIETTRSPGQMTLPKFAAAAANR